MDEILNTDDVTWASEKLADLQRVLNTVVFGQAQLIEHLITAIIAGGHVLLEGLPGLGKTELVKGLGKAVELEVKRIQFTPDLLPSDVTGSPMLEEHQGTRRFVFQPGPVFTHLLLADEINRASPKTQSALLEAMQEHHVTVMGETHALPQPFFVLATQNPIELEGTYPLPEAQLDRFLFKLDVQRGGSDVLERIITHRQMGDEPDIAPVLTHSDLMRLMHLGRRVYLPDVVANYIARLVDATHPGQSQAAAEVKFGASPRAALALAAAVRTRALIEGRINASFEDVEATAQPVLQHRLVLDYSARLQGTQPGDIVRALLHDIPKQPRPVAGVLNATPIS